MRLPCVGARGLGFDILRGFCQAGAAAVGILDVLEDLGDAAVKILKEEFGIPALFYKVVRLGLAGNING